MNTSINEKFIAYFALLSGIAISAVAMFYSVSGMIAIYPTALIPIIIMGVSIEVGKLSMTLWLKQNWDSPWVFKFTMIPAILILMLITSGGVFGFLSKAHSDQSLISGDAVSKVQLIDDKIFTVKENIDTQRENISAARTALGQLDSQVNARLDRGTDEVSAERSVQIRRNQRGERTALNREISDAQSEIAKLNEELAQLNAEKAPLAGELRKVEAEVGPVKYIAALIYGDNPDSNLLERAVRWVTLLIVIVLDPVAILLLLASQYSFQRIRDRENPSLKIESITEPIKPIVEENTTTSVTITATQTSIDAVVEINPVSTATVIIESPITLIDEPPIREPIKALPLDEPIVQVEEPKVEPIIDVLELDIKDEVKFETIDLESVAETEDLVETPVETVFDPADDIVAAEEPPATADSEVKVDHTPTAYIQNEEQQESNLWSNTSLNSISQDEYIEKVRKLKGIQ